MGAVRVRSARTARSAFISWLTPMTTLTRRMAKIAAPSGTSLRTTSVTSPATSSRIDIGSASWRTARADSLGGLGCGSSFGPHSASRREAASSVSPVSARTEVSMPLSRSLRRTGIPRSKGTWQGTFGSADGCREQRAYDHRGRPDVASTRPPANAQRVSTSASEARRSHRRSGCHQLFIRPASPRWLGREQEVEEPRWWEPCTCRLPGLPGRGTHPA